MGVTRLMRTKTKTAKDPYASFFFNVNVLRFFFHQVINRSAKYKNKYVHKRDSVSLANFTLQELQAQADLGLIVHPDSEDDEVRAPCLRALHGVHIRQNYTTTSTFVLFVKNKGAINVLSTPAVREMHGNNVTN